MRDVSLEEKRNIFFLIIIYVLKLEKTVTQVLKETKSTVYLSRHISDLPVLIRSILFWIKLT